MPLGMFCFAQKVLEEVISLLCINQMYNTSHNTEKESMVVDE